MKFAIVTITLIVIVLAAIIAGCYGCDCKTCNEQTKGMGFPHKWGIFSGCMIEVNGSWMPLDNYRYFEGDK